MSVESASAIQFIDLQTQQSRIRKSIEKRLLTILDHQAYIGGPEVNELEGALIKYTGAQDCIAVSNGTQALIMALMALEVRKGDAIFLPGFTYNATANAVCLLGAQPCFVDVNLQTATICHQDLILRIEQAKKKGFKPRVVLPVDLYGMPADYHRIKGIADQYNMTVLADAAQSFGSLYKGKSVGTLAEITTTSFYPAKILGCYGDGGAIFVDHQTEIAEKIRSIRWHGTGSDKGDSIRVGINGRLDTMQCAVVLEKLTIFADELAVRRRFARLYQTLLEDCVAYFKAPEDVDSCYSLFTIRTKHREALEAGLKAAGVPCVIYYKSSLPQMPAFRAYSPAGGLPNCEQLAREVLSLPLHPYLTEAQIHYICEQIRSLTLKAA